jgi:hypothetical protein
MVMDGDAMAAAANTKARAKIVADAFPTMEFVNDVWCVHLQLHPPVRSVGMAYWLRVFWPMCSAGWLMFACMSQGPLQAWNCQDGRAWRGLGGRGKYQPIVPGLHNARWECRNRLDTRTGALRIVSLRKVCQTVAELRTVRSASLNH